MLFCRSWILVCGLLIINASICCAQNPTHSAADYWKNAKSSRNRTAFRSFQESDEDDSNDQLSRDLDIDSDLDEEQTDDAMDDRQPADDVFIWPEQPIGVLDINPRKQLGKKPDDRSHLLAQQFTRNTHQLETVLKNYRWQAPNISYQPLYFEDIALERYGQSRRGLRQSLISYGHFFKSAALLRLHMDVDPPYSCDYPLGYCRPGVCTSSTRQKHFWR